MIDFYISELSATGPTVDESRIEFTPGVNIIYGPSNTGKSMVVDCIDYMLGASEPPFDSVDTKYSCVSMTLRNEAGQEIRLERDVLNEEEATKASSKVRVQSTAPSVSSGEYTTGSKGTLSGLLMGLIGVDEPVEIIASQEGKPQRLTFRTFLHQLFLKEETIFTKKTIIDHPKTNAITPSLTALMYLIDERGTVDGDFESSKIKKAKKKAVTDYISGKFRYLERRNAELNEQLDLAEGEDVDSRIANLLSEVEETQNAINAADKESRKLLSDIYEESAKLEEARFLDDRYAMLQTQYESDIARLEFIVDGEESGKSGYADHCPFCMHEIESEEHTASYKEASKAELAKVNLQLTELQSTRDDVAHQIADHMATMGYLRDEHEKLRTRIEGTLKPYIKELQNSLSAYREIESIRAELQANSVLYEVLNVDYNIEEAKDVAPDKYDAKQKFDTDSFTQLALAVSDAIKACEYTGFNSATLSRRKFDVVVNGKDKRNEGKGYRAFLNSLFAFTLMRFLRESAMHAPRMLVLDSPILSLKEKSQNESASSSMKSSLFQYIIDNAGDCQVIIAENEIPDEVDYDLANLIEFTQRDDYGQYGFLASHR